MWISKKWGVERTTLAKWFKGLTRSIEVYQSEASCSLSNAQERALVEQGPSSCLPREKGSREGGEGGSSSSARQLAKDEAVARKALRIGEKLTNARD